MVDVGDGSVGWPAGQAVGNGGGRRRCHVDRYFVVRWLVARVLVKVAKIKFSIFGYSPFTSTY